MLKFAVEFSHPIAIRYPRGEAYDGLKEFRQPVELGKSEIIYEGSKIALLAVGSMVKTALAVYHMLKEDGIEATLVNSRFVKPLDEEIIRQLSKEHKLFVTMEENVLNGGFGEKVVDLAVREQLPIKVLPIGLPDAYVEHGNVEVLKKDVGIDKDTVYDRILKESKELL